MSFIFYCLDKSFNKEFIQFQTSSQYLHVFWYPSLKEIVPPALSLFPFSIWWFLHQGRIFGNQNYSFLLIYDNMALIHRSGIFPRYFRFPFMGKDDLQIGDVWTAPEYRGKGLATTAIQHIIAQYQKRGRRFWYIVNKENHASIRVIEKAGFTKVGHGTRRGWLKTYTIQTQVKDFTPSQ